MCYIFLMKKLILVFGLLTNVFAHAHWDLGLGAGVNFQNVDDVSIATEPFWPNDYYTADNVDANAIFSAFVGYRLETDNEFLTAYSLRLNYLYGLSSEVSGNILQYSLPEFNNYDYQYDVQSQALFAQLKIDLYEFANISPFISGGIGAAWNRFSDYSETAKDNITPRVSPDYSNNTQSDFAFILGAGLDYEIDEDWFLLLEYNYADFGGITFGGSDADVTSNIILFSAGYTL